MLHFEGTLTKWRGTGLVFAGMACISLVVTQPAAWVADQWGRKAVIFPASVVLAASVLLMASAGRSAAWLTPCTVAQGITSHAHGLLPKTSRPDRTALLTIMADQSGVTPAAACAGGTATFLLAAAVYSVSHACIGANPYAYVSDVMPAGAAGLGLSMYRCAGDIGVQLSRKLDMFAARTPAWCPAGKAHN